MTALVTGASAGIGEAFARRLASEGHDLFLVARSEDKLDKLCSELSSKHDVKAAFIAIDLSEPGADVRVFDEAARLGLEIDLLINNAGFGSMGDFAKLDIERELEMVRLNVEVLVALTHRFLVPMRKKRQGTIINVSSTAGFQPIPFMATYAATKSFVSMFSEALCEENSPYGVHVFALCPGSTDTAFFDIGKVDRAFTAKGMEAPEQVVESGMRAIGSRKAKVISGWKNKIVARGSTFVPNWLIMQTIANTLRKKYQNK